MSHRVDDVRGFQVENAAGPGADPETATGIDGEGLHMIVGEAVLDVEDLDFVPVDAEESCSFRRDPDRAIGGLDKRCEVPAAVARGGGDAHMLELDAVESDDAAERGDPEEAVARLDDRANAVVGKTLFSCPGVESVVTERAGRIKSRCRFCEECHNAQYGADHTEAKRTCIRGLQQHPQKVTSIQQDMEHEQDDVCPRSHESAYRRTEIGNSVEIDLAT